MRTHTCTSLCKIKIMHLSHCMKELDVYEFNSKFFEAKKSQIKFGFPELLFEI